VTQSPDVNPPVRLLATFADAFPNSTPTLVLPAPGRDLWIAAGLNATQRYAVRALELDAGAVFNRQSAKRGETILRRPLPRWARYASGVVLALDTIDVPGVDALICGDEPQGPRYEYALGVAFAALWHAIADIETTPRGLIEIVDRVQRDYIGV
jgi:galactokinase